MVSALFHIPLKENSWRLSFLGRLLAGGLLCRLAGITVFEPLAGRDANVYSDRRTHRLPDPARRTFAVKMNLSAFVSGLLFSIGLILSGMTRPANIVGFLDVLGDWQPALLFVMAGALGVYALGYPRVRKRTAPLFAKTFDVPPPRPQLLRIVPPAAQWPL